MGLGIGPIGAYGASTMIRPMNYAVANQSKVSDAYTEGSQKSSGIGMVNPTQYANAKAYEVDPMKKLASAQAANKEFNQVAANYSGSVTGYGSDSSALGYEMLGSRIDLYA